MDSKRTTDSLRGVGLRVTAPRVATLAAVADHPHESAEVIASIVRNRLGTVSTQAIYDVLTALTDAGLLRRVTVDGRKSRFELELGDNHHHIVCTRCGRVQDVPCAQHAAPCMHPPVDTGFDVERAEVLFRGVCAECQQHQPKESDHEV